MQSLMGTPGISFDSLISAGCGRAAHFENPAEQRQQITMFFFLRVEVRFAALAVMVYAR